MPEPVIPASSIEVRFGTWINRGVQAYIDQWQAWLTLTLIAGAIAIVAYAMCLLPILIVAGPLLCGLHYCGLKSVRRERVDTSTLRRGWQMAGRSMIAFVSLTFMQLVPAAILYAALTAVFLVVLTSLAPFPRGPGARPMGPGGKAVAIQVEDFSDPAKRNSEKPEAKLEIDEDNSPASSTPGEPADGIRETDEAEKSTGPPTANVEFDFNPATGGGNAPGGFGGGAGRGGPPVPSGREFLVVLSIFGFYGFLFLAVVAMMLWWLWFGTKTMYVMPLIADRGCSFSEALTESWRLTRSRFWELVLVYFLASLLSGLGVYVCYVGVVATLPLYFTIIAAAYDAHALPQFTPAAEGAAGGE